MLAGPRAPPRRSTLPSRRYTAESTIFPLRDSLLDASERRFRCAILYPYTIELLRDEGDLAAAGASKMRDTRDLVPVHGEGIGRYLHPAAAAGADLRAAPFLSHANPPR